MIKSITSPSNPIIKKVAALNEKANLRRESGLFAVEGKKEVFMAIKGGYEPSIFIFNPNIITFNQLFDLYGDILFRTEMIEATNLIYNKIAYRESTEGIIAVFKQKNVSLDSVVLNSKSPLILVAESPEKPGNIGALMRTADAAGVDAVIIANPKTDIFNPNTIRSSIGTLFTNQVATGSTKEVINFLKHNKIQVFTTALAEGAQSCFDIEFTDACAIVVGTESTGLTEAWIKNADKNMIIPMRGKIDSINVSVSAAILLFEAVRQRQMK